MWPEAFEGDTVDQPCSRFSKLFRYATATYMCTCMYTIHYTHVHVQHCYSTACVIRDYHIPVNVKKYKNLYNKL